MTEQQIQAARAAGKVEQIAPPQQTAQPPPLPSQGIEEFLPILISLRTPRQHLTTAPTFIPKTFVDQIQLYDDGTHQRIYLYVNKTWRYATLT